MSDPPDLVGEFLNAVEERRNDLFDPYGEHCANQLPSRLRGLVGRFREKDDEITRSFTREHGDATSRAHTNLDAELRDLFRKQEIRRSRLREKWFSSLSETEKANFVDHCLFLAEQVLTPVFPNTLPDVLRGPFARLALEWTAICRRFEKEHKRLKCGPRRNWTVLDSLLRGLNHVKKEAKSRLIGPWYSQLSTNQATAFDGWPQAGVRRRTNEPPANKPDPLAKAKVNGKRRGGKPPLETRKPLQFQVYERIRREHQQGAKYLDTLDLLKRDKDFVTQVKDAKLKLDTNLIRKALAFFDQREREARKKQETPPS